MKKNQIFAAALIASASFSTQASILTAAGTVYDSDFTYAGVGGLRGNGAGEITLSGVSGSVTEAYLYWHGPTNSVDPDFNANAMFNGVDISGTNIGFSDDNFWSQTNSQAYRADVTGLVSGDGIFTLEGLSANNTNGASLVVYYDDGDSSNNMDIVSFEGNDANFDNVYDPLGWDTTLTGIDYDGSGASLLLGISDGQSFDDGIFSINGSGLSIEFDGDTVPATPGSSVSNGALWDLIEIDISSFLTVGVSNTLEITYSGGSDALSAIHYQVILPAGSAPVVNPPVGVSEAPAMMVMLMGLSGFAFRRMKKNS